jgi:hypothetical protein
LADCEKMVMSKRKQQCEKARAAKRAKREDEGRLMNSFAYQNFEEMGVDVDLVHHEEQQPHYNFDDDEFVSNENDSSEYVN